MTTTTVDIYARQSAKKRDDDRERSTEGQVAACRAVLAERGLAEGEVLIDPHRSAWNPEVKRPAWDALMSRLENGETGGMIVFDLERFSRQPADGERLIKLAARGLLILDSESEYDLTAANGKKNFRDAMTAAAFYSDRLSTRVKRGKELKAGKGEPASSCRPFGFLPASYKPGAPPPEHHPEEGAILRDLVARTLAGEPQDRLLRDLNDRGITTSYGKPWTRAGLRQVLLRPLNAGLVVHAGKVTSKPLPGEPLISREDYDTLTAMFAANRRGRPPSPAYLCSGAVVCGRCEHKLAGRPRTASSPYEDGEVRREYWCSYSHGGCGKIAIDQRGLDEHARELALTILSDPRHAAQVEAAAADMTRETGRLDAEIAKAAGLGRALGERLGRGEIDLDAYDAITGPLNRRLGELRAERSRLSVPGDAVPAERSRAAWEARWEAAEPAERRNLLKMALRGRVLIIGPADPHNRKDVSGRITVSERPQ